MAPIRASQMDQATRSESCGEPENTPQTCPCSIHRIMFMRLGLIPHIKYLSINMRKQKKDWRVIFEKAAPLTLFVAFYVSGGIKF